MSDEEKGLLEKHVQTILLTLTTASILWAASMLMQVKEAQALQSQTMGQVDSRISKIEAQLQRADADRREAIATERVQQLINDSVDKRLREIERLLKEHSDK